MNDPGIELGARARVRVKVLPKPDCLHGMHAHECPTVHAQHAVVHAPPVRLGLPSLSPSRFASMPTSIAAIPVPKGEGVAASPGAHQ